MATPDLETRAAPEGDPFRLIVEASGVLLGARSIEEVLPRVLALAQETLAADAYALWRLNPTTSTWYVSETEGLSEEYVESATEAIRGSDDSSVALDAPLAVEDIASADWLSPRHRDAHLREGTTAMLVTGLRLRHEILGTLVFYYREPHAFTERELSAASALANLATNAVENVRLYREAEGARSDAQQSLAQLNAAFTTAPIALAFLDRELRYVRVNDVLAQMNGLSADDHVGRHPRDVLPEGVGERAEAMHRRVLETGEAALEVPVTRRPANAPGEDRRLLASYYPVRGLSGDVIGVGVVGIDVTERERMRVEAEVVRERLAVLADASQQLASTLDYETTLANIASLLVPRYADWYAVDLLDADGRFRRIAVVHHDPAKAEWAARSQRDYPPDLSEPEGPGRVVREGEAVLYREIPDELLASSTRDPEHHRILRELGMATAMVVPLRAGGRVFGTLMLVSADPERPYEEDDLDFAQHLARRAAVAVDNALLYRTAQERGHAALVVEHVADGVALVDSLGVIRLWNPAAERITGLGAAEVLNVPAAKVFPSWDSILRLARERGARVETQPMEIDGRELWLSLSGFAFDEGTVFAFRDLTAEREVERLKSDFVATISHELRTPLAAIYGAALTLRRRDVRLGEPQRSGLLEVIANESDRLARIVNDILWASRLESGTMQTTIERTDAIALAREIVDAAAQYSPPNVRLVFDAPSEPPLVACDPDKVRQVVTNLIDNAIKYSPDGGSVSIAAHVVGDRLRFAVNDEGLGIPAEEQERIFEKFYRLDPNLTRGVGGTGLGLYISRELVERMGGRIWVESSGTSGSTFFFELPVA